MRMEGGLWMEGVEEGVGGDGRGEMLNREEGWELRWMELRGVVKR